MKILKRFVKYGWVAAGSACTDWAVFATGQFLGANYLLAQVASRMSGGVFSFVVNRFWSFESGPEGHITVQGRRFLLLYVFSYGLSLLLMYFQVGILGNNTYVSKLIADSICFVFNFTVMNVYVYKDRKGLIHGLKTLFRVIRKTA